MISQELRRLLSFFENSVKCCCTCHIRKHKKLKVGFKATNKQTSLISTRLIVIGTIFIKRNKSIRTTMPLSWAVWDILGHFGTLWDNVVPTATQTAFFRANLYPFLSFHCSFSFPPKLTLAVVSLSRDLAILFGSIMVALECHIVGGDFATPAGAAPAVAQA